MERRESYRAKLRREVSGRVPATPVVVTVLDISTSGCLVEAKRSIAPGTTILLDLAETDEVAGQVVWRDGDRMGIKFHDKIGAETLLRVVGSSTNDFREDDSLKDSFGRELPELSGRIRSKLV